jgi:uncharacterized membrane protein
VSGRSAGFLAHVANFLLLMAMWGLALWAYDALPDTIPVHFDAAGMPDRIVPRTYTSWLMLPGSAAGMTVLLYLSALFVPLMRVRPNMVNLPSSMKKRFLALTEEEREPVLAIIAAMIFWMPAPMNVLFLWLTWQMYSAAVSGGGIGTGFMPVLLLILALVAMTVAFLVWVHREMERAGRS